VLGDQVGKSVSDSAGLDVYSGLFAGILAEGRGDLDPGHRLYMMPQERLEIQP
jgi:acetate kinase